MNTATRDDNFYMDIALKIARQAKGWTSPNPMVGAVIVKNGVIIGRGFHRRAGAAHAEVEALNNAKTDIRGATLYVNLEPCAHHGKTPPCTDAIIRAGIKKVICSIPDPNVKVHGKGIERLRSAGIEVIVGVRAEEARCLNETFMSFHEKGRPFVAVKFAVSLDGKLATHAQDSQWITNDSARNFARNLRSQYQAILVGINTVMHDNPHLGARQLGAQDPLRIILDSKLRISADAQVLRDSNVLIATTEHASLKRLHALEQKDVEVLVFEGYQVSIVKLMQVLQKKQIISVLVEGGGETLGSFIDAAMVDKVYAFYAPLLIGGSQANSIGGQGSAKVADALHLDTISIRRFSDNFLIMGYPGTVSEARG